MSSVAFPQTLTVNVTQRDINKGCQSSPGNCPIARAFKRALHGLLGNKFHYSVGTSVATSYNVDYPEQVDAVYALGIKGEEFVRAFDRDGGDAVNPTKLSLRLWR